MNRAYTEHKRITEMSEREYVSFKKMRSAMLRMKNNIVKLAMILVSVMILTFSVKAITAMASNADHKAVQKYYKTVSIGYDDTLYSIAVENFDSDHYRDVTDYLKEITDINHISEDSAISGGAVIYIPYYGEMH